MSNPEKAGNLYVKSFFAASIPLAMREAQREFGPDALLLNSREAPPEARHLGQYEVVFGTRLENTAPSVSVANAGSRVEELHDRLRKLRETIGRIQPSSPMDADDETGAAHGLMDAGMEPALAHFIERGIRRRMSGAAIDISRRHETPGLKAATSEELAGRFSVQPEIGRITALVGPPGSGKTTTLVKLAVTQCLQQNRAVKLISADRLRIGGAGQLRTFANLLGVPFVAVEGGAALGQAIDSTPAGTAVLIDTPGLSPAMQQELGGDLAALFARRQDIDTHLVLTASMNGTYLANAATRFACFQPGKLIFTHLDETTSYATVFSEAARARKPISFLCHGQSIPEDIEAANKERIIESLVSQLPEALQAVA